MTIARDIAGETIKALAVLALVFLSFAHMPPAQAGAPFDGGTSCIAGSADEPGAPEVAHEPCHACRAELAALPPPPCAAEPLLFAGDAPMPVRAAAFTDRNGNFSPARPRAPPVLV